MASFNERYGSKPIFGMIHLAGALPIRRALDELLIYQEEGLTGAIIENYHCDSLSAVEGTLRQAQGKFSSLHLGVNILPNEFSAAFDIAQRFGGTLIQIDHVAGEYEEGTLPVSDYLRARSAASGIHVLGGVHPKYYTPRSALETDIAAARSRADAIVVTGERTGKETPISKINQFRTLAGDYPLIVGAGLTPANVYEQLLIADGAIVGSTFKQGGNTNAPVDRLLVREFMAAVRDARKH